MIQAGTLPYRTNRGACPASPLAAGGNLSAARSVFLGAWRGSGASLRSICDLLPGDTVHLAYGTSPRIQITTIAGRTGCYIWPSADAPAMPVREGASYFRSAAALIPYRRPVGNGGTFQYLFITADPAHIQQIANSVEFQGTY